jgi:peptidoglycan hydrolase-like protein with peptidoglycan-binding domain
VNQSDFKDVAVESKYAKDVINKADSSWKSHMEKVKQKNLSKTQSDKLKSRDVTLKDVLENKFEFKFGDMGQGVKQIQSMLKKLGYDLGTSGVNKDGVDGNYGINTSVSVIEFQKEYNLSEPDGIVGDKTLKKLTELTR